jgi:hypothetical protein
MSSNHALAGAPAVDLPSKGRSGRFIGAYSRSPASSSRSLSAVPIRSGFEVTKPNVSERNGVGSQNWMLDSEPLTHVIPKPGVRFSSPPKSNSLPSEQCVEFVHLLPFQMSGQRGLRLHLQVITSGHRLRDSSGLSGPWRPERRAKPVTDSNAWLRLVTPG